MILSVSVGYPLLSDPSRTLVPMTKSGLRQWRGVKPVAAPSGVVVETRLRTTPVDDRVVEVVAGLPAVVRSTPVAGRRGPPRRRC